MAQIPCLARGMYYSLFNGRHAVAYRQFRRPRTTQERRRWFSDLAEGQEHPALKLRACRSFRGLPNTYDDISIGPIGRSWKLGRKTQYYPVDNRAA